MDGPQKQNNRLPPANGRAVAALIVGIAALAVSLFGMAGIPFAMAGIVLGIIARKEPSARGRGAATGGLACSAAALILSCIVLITCTARLASLGGAMSSCGQSVADRCAGSFADACADNYANSCDTCSNNVSANFADSCSNSCPQ